MRRFAMLLCLLTLGLSSVGCCCCGSNSCYWYNACCNDPEDADDDCYCCTDGAESARYRPPGPWWTRPDCGCHNKCRRYQMWKEGVCEEAKNTVNYRY